MLAKFLNPKKAIIEGARAEGKAEGELEKAKKIAKKMLSEDLEINLISRFTNLTIEEIEQLKAELES